MCVNLTIFLNGRSKKRRLDVLVLSRLRGQSIVLGGGVFVKVEKIGHKKAVLNGQQLMLNQEIIVNVGEEIAYVKLLNAGGGKVRLGIEAPRSISVHREEIQMRVDREQKLS